MFSALGTGAPGLMHIICAKNIVSLTISQVNTSDNSDLYYWIFIILGVVFVIAGIYILNIVFADTKKEDTLEENDELDRTIAAAGYAYDQQQDIFYSILDPWQRTMGYCRLYDEAAGPFGIIVDCDTVYFEYNEKKWLIEFWKGQYDLTTGCEVGIYNTSRTDFNIPDVFNGTFYDCAGNEDLLPISYILKKNGKKLFTRKDRHWWLTGFKIGEFTEPSELTMLIRITLKDKIMCDAFIKGLMEAGYLQKEIMRNGNTVSLKFDHPHTKQPISRTKETDYLIQKKNKLLCDMYQDLTGSYGNSLDKIRAIKEKAPDIYEQIMNMGKNKQLFMIYDKIKKYLD